MKNKKLHEGSVISEKNIVKNCKYNIHNAFYNKIFIINIHILPNKYSL